jgi:hypothetical protein
MRQLPYDTHPEAELHSLENGITDIKAQVPQGKEDGERSQRALDTVDRDDGTPAEEYMITDEQNTQPTDRGRGNIPQDKQLEATTNNSTIDEQCRKRECEEDMEEELGEKSMHTDPGHTEGL